MQNEAHKPFGIIFYACAISVLRICHEEGCTALGKWEYQ